MSSDHDELKVSIVGAEGRWEVLLEINGKAWKRYGPWKDYDTAKLYASEALRRANKVAEKYWNERGVSNPNE